jgi:hypothetical protein
VRWRPGCRRRGLWVHTSTFRRSLGGVIARSAPLLHAPMLHSPIRLLIARPSFASLPGDWASSEDKKESRNRLSVTVPHIIRVAIAVNSFCDVAVVFVRESHRLDPMEVAEDSFCCLKLRICQVRAKLPELPNCVRQIRARAQHHVHEGANIARYCLMWVLLI